MTGYGADILCQAGWVSIIAPNRERGTVNEGIVIMSISPSYVNHLTKNERNYMETHIA